MLEDSLVVGVVVDGGQGDVVEGYQSVPLDEVLGFGGEDGADLLAVLNAGH